MHLCIYIYIYVFLYIYIYIYTLNTGMHETGSVQSCHRMPSDPTLLFRLMVFYSTQLHTISSYFLLAFGRLARPRVWSCTSAQSCAIAQRLKGAAAPTLRRQTKYVWGCPHASWGLRQNICWTSFMIWYVMRIYIYIYIYTYTHTYTCIHIYIYIYIHIELFTYLFRPPASAARLLARSGRATPEYFFSGDALARCIGRKGASAGEN